MAGLDIQISGLEHALKTLDKYERRALRNRLNRAVAAGGRLARDAIRQEAPIGDPAIDPRSGETKRNVKVKSLRGGGVVVGPWAPGSHNAAWFKITAVIYGRKRGNHGRTPPHPYVVRGVKRVRDRILRTIVDAAIGR